MKLRHGLRSYLEILSGSLGRALLQAIYFGLLVSTLSLADYGVFASAVAAALIIASGGSFGFAAPLFRAATTRRRVLGWYLGSFYAYVAAGLPLTLGLAIAVHAVALKSYMSLAAFLAIVVSEAVCWRLMDAISSVNVGTGRVALGSLVTILGSGLRTLAVVAFGLFGAGSLEDWSFFYLAANIAGAAACMAFFQPPTRLRWSRHILLRRLPEAYSYAAMNLIQSLQTEADKLLILFLTNQSAAGLYALSMRIIDLAAIPVRSFLSLYVLSLMRRRGMLHDLGTAIRVEAAIALTTVLLFGAFVAALSFQPTMLGSNIGTAYGWFSGLTIVAAARALMDYHRVVFFAANRLFTFVMISVALLAIKGPALALIATLIPDPYAWIVPLNWLFAALYVVSALLTWRLIIRGRPAAAALSDAFVVGR
jgi:O-antigen/teichoic acid export membrane protein